MITVPANIGPSMSTCIHQSEQTRADNGSVNRAATVSCAIDLSVASPLRVQHHVIRRHIIVKQFEPKFRLITGNTERNDSANPSMKHIARKAHQARLRFRTLVAQSVSRACLNHPPIKNRQERITVTITEPEG